MNTINPNEAPEGCVAVEYVECSKCVFWRKDSCDDVMCTPEDRDDMEFVMFVVREDRP